MISSPDPRILQIADYNYDLPSQRIASFPLSNRDDAKLLIYKENNITSSFYHSLPQHIPQEYLLVFNKTRVVEARLLFTKPTGGQIEIFCLEPESVYPDITTAMNQTGEVYWNCLVGGAAKWKSGLLLQLSVANADESFILSASVTRREAEHFVIHFSWTNKLLSFAEVLHLAGQIPIPPYLNRAPESSDQERYQTVYAKDDGSVAAPTAGLHFTPGLMKMLLENKINSAFLTLHVGAGTFKPVKSNSLAGHDMHAEFFEADRSLIENILAAGEKLIAVGTTSLRTLESLYWMGVKSIQHPQMNWMELAIQQWEVYDELEKHVVPVNDSLNALLRKMELEGNNKIISKTQILIAPGYQIRMVKGILTNFHQPQSTLLLLIAAIIGPQWKKIYDYALENEYRFLSFGDGSLIWCNQDVTI